MEATLRTSRLSAVPRPIVAFAILFVLAEAIKITRGDTLWAVVDAVLAVILAIACGLTAHFTGKEAPEARPAERGSLLPVQLAACTIVFLATMFGAPGWNAFRERIYSTAAASMPPDFALGIANFVTFCFPIAIVLLVLRVPLTQQGLGRFRKGSFPSAVAWLSLPIAIFALAIAFGKVGITTVAAAWLSNLLKNGVSEEFLWRGAIFGRLRTVMSTYNAIVLQALLFGLWHWNANMSGYHGDVVNVVADMVASQGLFGVAAAYVTMRTGNIAISSAFHLLFDSLGMFQ